MRRKRTAVGAGGGGVLLVAGLLFEPWRAFTSSEVDQAVPMTPVAGVLTAPSASPDRSAPSRPEPVPSPSVVPRDRELARGALVDAEHETSGTVRILELADGSRFLRLEGLDSSDGPDLHVILSDAASGGEWGSYDDGRHVELGELMATRGNQNYAIPEDVTLEGIRSAVIWCDRFDVAFRTAPLSLS